MRFAAVESAHDFFLQPVGLHRFFGLDHLFGEPAQLLRAELAVFADKTGELNDPALFVARQPFYFLDDFNRCHASKLLTGASRRKRRLQFGKPSSPRSGRSADAKLQCGPQTKDGAHGLSRRSLT